MGGAAGGATWLRPLRLRSAHQAEQPRGDGAFVPLVDELVPAGDAFARRRHRGDWVYSPSLARAGVTHHSIVRRVCRGGRARRFPAAAARCASRAARPVGGVSRSHQGCISHTPYSRGRQIVLAGSASLGPLPGAQSVAHCWHRNPVRVIGYPLPVSRSGARPHL